MNRNPLESGFFPDGRGMEGAAVESICRDDEASQALRRPGDGWGRLWRVALPSPVPKTA